MKPKTNEEESADILDVYAEHVVEKITEFCKTRGVGLESGLEAAVAIAVDLCHANELDPDSIFEPIKERYNVLYGTEKGKISIVDVEQKVEGEGEVDSTPDRSTLN